MEKGSGPDPLTRTRPRTNTPDDPMRFSGRYGTRWSFVTARLLLLLLYDIVNEAVEGKMLIGLFIPTLRLFSSPGR